MYKEGEEVYVDLGIIEGRVRRIKWKRGVIKKVYSSWYLIDFGAYRSGVKEMDIRKEIEEDGRE